MTENFAKTLRENDFFRCGPLTDPIPPLARFGIIGFGEHAKNICSSFSRAKNVQLRAIGSQAVTTPEFAQRKAPHVEVCGDYAELLKRSDVDAVLIALPNHLHAEWIERSLASGKHVLCEKPLCLDSETAKNLAQMARSRGLRLAEAFPYREHPQHRAVKELLHDGRFGSASQLEVRFTYELRDLSNIRRRRAPGAGILYDAGCYGIDCARFYFGAEPVDANGSVAFDSHGVDEEAEFELQFADGRIATVFCSMKRPRESSVTITCERGRILIPSAFHVQATQKLSISLLEADQPARTAPQASADQYALFLDRFAESLRPSESQANGVQLEDGVLNMTALDMVRSACSGHSAL